jgi:hypothetical protein
MPIREVCSPVNAMKRGTPLTGADPKKRGALHTSVYGDRYGDTGQRTKGLGAHPSSVSRAAPGDPDPHRAAQLAGEFD